MANRKKSHDRRNANGDGTIYKMKIGKYRVQITLPNGKRSLKTFETYREAQEWRDEIRWGIHELKKNPRAKNLSSQLLEDYLLDWLKKCKSGIKPSTYFSYKGVIENIIIPRIGKLKLAEINPKIIRSLYDQYQQEKRRDRSAFLIKQVLNKSLNDAERDGLILENPVPRAGIKYSKKIQPMVKVWNDEQLNHLLDAMAGEKYECLIRLALMTGIRQGELLGLKWEDVDLSEGKIFVRRSLQKAESNGKMGYELGSPKTATSVRQIEIGNNGMSVLSAQQKNVEEMRQLAGNLWKENDLVFPSRHGTPINPSNLMKEYKSYLKKAAIPEATFHYLRHHAASLMIREKADPATVARILGHSNSIITQQRYIHFFDKSVREVTSHMETMFAMGEIEPTKSPLMNESSTAHTLHTNGNG